MTAAVSADARRPSGVGWLGDVPGHWRVANIRKFATMKTGHTPSRGVREYWDNCTIPWFTLGDVWQLRDGSRKHLGETRERISELGLANSAAELLPAGTVVLSRTASVGFPGVMAAPMATSQDFWNWVCGPELLSDYLFWIFRSMTDEFRAMMHGSTHKTIYEDAAAAIQIPIPPLAEQRRIADYLDAECARLDHLLERRRLQATLTEERFESYLDELLVSPCGQEVPLQLITDPKRPIQYGIVLPGPDVDDGVPIIKGGDIGAGRVKRGMLKRTTHEIDARYSRSRVRGGDLVIAIRGSVGELAEVPDDLSGANLTQDSARVAPCGSDPAWLRAVLETPTVQQRIASVVTGATIKGINIADLRRVRVPLPARPEDQKRLGALAARARSESEDLTHAMRRSVDLLRERKQALITAAVTGKFDVSAASGRAV